MGKFLNFLILVQNLGELLNFFKGPYFQKTEGPTQTGSEKLRKTQLNIKKNRKCLNPSLKCSDGFLSRKKWGEEQISRHLRCVKRA